MTRLWGFLARLRKNDKGASLIEYSILIGLITVAAILSIDAVGGWVASQWASLSSILP